MPPAIAAIVFGAAAFVAIIIIIIALYKRYRNRYAVLA